MPPFATDALREHLANQLSVPREQISLLGWQPVTWRDSCLGVHQPQEMCLTVITPGYTFKFQAGATTAVINTNVSGKSYRLAEKTESPGPLPALSWTRTGGLAGTCQNLSVFSTGAYLLRDCKTASILAQGALTGAQVTYLNAQFEQYTSFDWQSELPPGAADMFSDQVIFYGAGSRVMAATEQQKLNAYLAGLAGELENTK